MNTEFIDYYAIKSWDEYIKLISEITNKYKDIKLYYRGQSDYNWKLESTLERVSSNAKMEFMEYCRNIHAISGFVQSVSGETFSLSPLQDLIIKQNDNYHTVDFVPSYQYWVYLRQHGFPSPMLDWTASPIIAAFFAMWESKVASCVWIYIERPEGFKLEGSSMTNIRLMGPFTGVSGIIRIKFHKSLLTNKLRSQLL